MEKKGFSYVVLISNILKLTKGGIMHKLIFSVLLLLLLTPGLLYGETGKWNQAEIKYFQEKEYIGDKKLYSIYSIDFYPPYIKGEKIKEEYGIINEKDLKDIILTGKASKEEILHYLRLLRNEIYARRGYIFRSKNLREFFEKMDWYTPEVTEVELNGDERYNIKKLKKYEKIVGSTKPEKELYTKEVIIEAKWGNGPGEFALEPLPESNEYVTCFTIASNSDIYILDPNNVKINIFDESGNFIKDIPIPSEFIYTYGEKSTSLVEGISTDSKGNLYLASSSAHEEIEKRGEVVLKMDEGGKVIEKYVFRQTYVYPPVFYEDSNNKMYLWGSWQTTPFSYTSAVIPLEYGKGKGIDLKNRILSSSSYKNNGNAIKLLNKRIKITGEKVPITFNISRDSKVTFYDGSSFISQNANGKMKAKHSIYWRYYPRGYGFPHKGGEVSVSALPIIDKKLNLYCLAGTSEGLHVIKYTFK